MPMLAVRSKFLVRGQSLGRNAPPSGAPVHRTFRVPRNAGEPALVTLNESVTEVIVEVSDMEVEENFLAWLKTADRFYGNEYPEAAAAHIAQITETVTAAARSVVEATKYFLGRVQMPDDVLGGLTETLYSESGGDFRPVPGLMRAYGLIQSQIGLSDDSASWIQEALDAGRAPFLGVRHLFRAVQEASPRFKWIDATIAAELSVKEALIRAEPRVGQLLLELPSPPLGKLYGQLLKHYFGEASPFRAKLEEGAARRNKLVHRPDSADVTLEEAEQYIDTVKKAIDHLYGLLYPKWPLVAELKNVVY